MKTLKVAKTSRATAVAGAIAWAIRDEGSVEIEAVGAGAVNQATKAVAIARGYLALEGVDVVLVPSFTTVEIGDDERTALRLLVEPRKEVARQAGGAGQPPLALAAGR